MSNFPLGDISLGAPIWLYLTGLLVIFWLHVLSIWLLIGTAILGLVEIVKNKENWQQSKAIRYLPIIMAIALNLGVPPLLFMQVLYAPFLFTSSILIAIPWISVVFLLMFSYGLIYAARYGAKHSWQAITFITLATFGILLISFIFSNNMTLLLKPEIWTQLYSYKQNGFNLNPNIFEVISRWIWVLSPIFVAGTALLNRSKFWAIPTIILSIAGLFAYKTTWTEPVVNNNLVNISLVADLTLIGILAIILFIPFKNHKFQQLGFFGWLGFKGLSVVALRHGIRCASLDPIYPLSKIPTDFQPFLIAIFIISLVIGGWALAWMYLNGRKGLSI